MSNCKCKVEAKPCAIPLVVPPERAQVLYLEEAEAARTAAQNAANETQTIKTDVEQIAGNYTIAKETLENVALYKQQAQTAATTAIEQATISTTKATEASASATLATQKADIAITKAGEANTSANRAEVIVSALDTIDTSGVASQVVKNTSNIAEISVLIEPTNWLDQNNILDNYYIGQNGQLYANSNYQTTDYIPVTEGDTVVTYRIESASSMPSIQMRFLCAFDSGKNVISSKGADSVYSYTVPEGVAYIRISTNVDFHVKNKCIVKDGIKVAYTEYFRPYIQPVDRDRILSLEERATNIETDLSKDVPAQKIDVIDRTGHNYLNDIIEEHENSYWVKTGNTIKISPNNVYKAILVPISELGRYSTNGLMVFRFIDVLDTNRYVLEHFDSKAAFDVTNTNAKYLALTLYNDHSYDLTIDGQPSIEQYKVKGQWIFEDLRTEEKKLHTYLPKEICVGVGRTIELYNSLVCLEADKYHLDWNCSVGIDYARKITIEGKSSNIGTYPLTLTIYDDNLKIVKTLTSTVKIVDNNIASSKNIIPIGDSLTNSKPWITEVKTLSNNKINYIGTRRGHEGRSGATAAWYNADSTYSFDSAYSGNPSIDRTKNPFWDGTKFSLQYYINNQSSYIGTPNAVQLLLGTNAIALDPTNNVNQIKTIVDNIRAEYPSMPIFVCNTIYRSTQDGYYSTGSDGYASAGDFQYSADMKVMNLQNALAEALEGYSNVYIVPLSVCMDRDYNFGNKEVTVNPRSTITTFIPNESVHPQQAGYLQMADVMYSTYIAYL